MNDAQLRDLARAVRDHLSLSDRALVAQAAHRHYTYAGESMERADFAALCLRVAREVMSRGGRN